MMELIIVGGGASGMMAAISAARANEALRITIAERMDRVGKKLLATGNGRCNFTNVDISAANYHGGDITFTESCLRSFNTADTIDFFESIGVFHKVEKNGKVFPYSDQASSVLDVLRNELDRLGVKIITGYEASRIEKGKRFKITSADDRVLYADKVILSAGGCANSDLGSNGTGFSMLKALGHTISPLFPALVQIKTDADTVKPMKGIKFLGGASLIDSKGAIIKTEYGEILFTDYGLSGPPIFELSAFLRESDAISLDFMPDFSHGQIFSILCGRRESLCHLTMEHFFTGLFNKRIGYAIAKKSGIEKLSFPVSKLNKDIVSCFCSAIKDFRISGLSPNGFRNAQVTGGGVLTGEFDKKTLQSKIVHGLFVTGELFDIFGDCGGFNLQWAWSSGFVAGKNAAGIDE